MSWVTTGIKMKDNEPNDFEFHNWNEENMDVALKWLKEYAKRGFVVTLYHKTDGIKSPNA